MSGNSGNGGLAINAEIKSPAGLCTDKLNNLYISDADNSNVRMVSKAGIIITIAGNGTLGYSGDGGPATDAAFHSPGDVGIDSSGNIIVADILNNALRKVNVSTGIITTIAGTGIASYGGDGGPASSAKLNTPYGIFIDKSNNIYFSDCLNGAIRKIEGATGIITTVAGSGTQGYSGDGGPATDAKLAPDDVFLDKYGTMYIADYGNQRIRMVYNPKLSAPVNEKTIAEVKVFPNPTKNELTIEYYLPSEDAVIQIADVMDRLVITKNLKSQKQKEPFGKRTMTIDISSLSQGVYLYKVICPGIPLGQNGASISTGRILKE